MAPRNVWYTFQGACTSEATAAAVADALAKRGIAVDRPAELAISAALNVVGAVKLARKLKADASERMHEKSRRLSVATVLCDGGERYRTTTFNPAWLKEKGLEPKWSCLHDVRSSLQFIKAA